MKKSIKIIVGTTLGIVIGASTLVGAATIFRSEDITYSSPTNKTNVKEFLDELYDLTSNYEFYKPLADQVELGDYISMTPISTSYTPSEFITGCTKDNNCTQETLNPSELNLWRVIKKNSDGTIEVVSQYTSSVNVNFMGLTGLVMFVGTLNEISSQYTNPKYVEKTRNIGYINQIEFCHSVSSCQNDSGYKADLDLLKAANIPLYTTDIDGIEHSYWLSSRYIIDNADGSRNNLGYLYRKDGVVAWDDFGLLRSDGSFSSGNVASNAIRPILTFKATNVIKSGDGKSAETAYSFV